MSQDRLRELLTSPLEPSRRERPKASRAPRDRQWNAGWFVAAVLAGAAAVAAGWAVGRPDTEPAPTTTTTTTADPFDGAPQGLPSDYAPVGDHLGIRAERILVRDDATFVAFTTVAVNSLDPSATRGFQGGLWTLVLQDGSTLVSTTEGFDPLAQGAVSVAFPSGDYSVDEIESVELTATARRLQTVFEFESPGALEATLEAGQTVAVLPAATIDLDEGVRLDLGPTELQVSGSSIGWTLGGEARANAYVEPTLRVIRPDGSETVLRPFVPSSAFNFFHPSVPAPPLTRQGQVTFADPGPQGLAAPAGTTFELVLDVVWAIYEPTETVIPLDEVARAQVG